MVNSSSNPQGRVSYSAAAEFLKALPSGPIDYLDSFPNLEHVSEGSDQQKNFRSSQPTIPKGDQYKPLRVSLTRPTRTPTKSSRARLDNSWNEAIDSNRRVRSFPQRGSSLMSNSANPSGNGIVFPALGRRSNVSGDQSVTALPLAISGESAAAVDLDLELEPEMHNLDPSGMTTTAAKHLPHLTKDMVKILMDRAAEKVNQLPAILCTSAGGELIQVPLPGPVGVPGFQVMLSGAIKRVPKSQTNRFKSLSSPRGVPSLQAEDSDSSHSSKGSNLSSRRSSHTGMIGGRMGRDSESDESSSFEESGSQESVTNFVHFVPADATSASPSRRPSHMGGLASGTNSALHSRNGRNPTNSSRTTSRDNTLTSHAGRTGESRAGSVIDQPSRRRRGRQAIGSVPEHHGLGSAVYLPGVNAWNQDLSTLTQKNPSGATSMLASKLNLMKQKSRKSTNLRTDRNYRLLTAWIGSRPRDDPDTQRLLSKVVEQIAAMDDEAADNEAEIPPFDPADSSSEEETLMVPEGAILELDMEEAPMMPISLSRRRSSTHLSHKMMSNGSMDPKGVPAEIIQDELLEDAWDSYVTSTHRGQSSGNSTAASPKRHARKTANADRSILKRPTQKDLSLGPVLQSMGPFLDRWSQESQEGDVQKASLSRFRELLEPREEAGVPPELVPFMADPGEETRINKAQVQRRVDQCTEIMNSVLDISFCPHMSRQDVGVVYSVLKISRFITRLQAFNNALSPSGVDGLVKMLLGCPWIRVLDLRSNYVVDAEAVKKLSVLFDPQHQLSLSELSLAQCKIGNQGFLSLATGLRCNQSLTRLDVSNANISDAGVCGLEDLWGKGCRLSHLNLSWNQFSKVGLHDLCAGFGVHVPLVTLDLSHCSLKDDAMTPLAEFVTHSSTLAVLNLTGNLISWVGAEALAPGVAVNVSLVELHLEDNPLGRHGAITLLKPLLKDEVSAHLRRVALAGCTLTANASEPLLVDVSHPHGLYTIDLAQPTHREVAVTLVGIWQASGGTAWAEARYEGRGFKMDASLNWPEKLPETGILVVNVRLAASLKPDSPSLPVGLIASVLEDLRSLSVSDLWRGLMVDVVTRMGNLVAREVVEIVRLFAYREEKVRATAQLLYCMVDPPQLLRVLAALDSEDQAMLWSMMGIDNLLPWWRGQLCAGWEQCCTGHISLDLGKHAERLAAVWIIGYLQSMQGVHWSLEWEPGAPPIAVLGIGCGILRLVDYEGRRKDKRMALLEASKLPLQGTLQLDLVNLVRPICGRHHPCPLKINLPQVVPKLQATHDLVDGLSQELANALDLPPQRRACMAEHFALGAELGQSRYYRPFAELLGAESKARHALYPVIAAQKEAAAEAAREAEELRAKSKKKKKEKEVVDGENAEEKGKEKKKGSPPSSPSDKKTPGKSGKGGAAGGKEGEEPPKSKLARGASRKKSADGTAPGMHPELPYSWKLLEGGAAGYSLIAPFRLFAANQSITCFQVLLLLLHLPSLPLRLDALVALWPGIWDRGHLVDVILALDRPPPAPESQLPSIQTNMRSHRRHYMTKMSVNRHSSHHTTSSSMKSSEAIDRTSEPSSEYMSSSGAAAPAGDAPEPQALDLAAAAVTPGFPVPIPGFNPGPNPASQLLGLAAQRLGWRALMLPWSTPGMLADVPLTLNLEEPEELMTMMNLCRWVDRTGEASSVMRSISLDGEMMLMRDDRPLWTQILNALRSTRPLPQANFVLSISDDTQRNAAATTLAAAYRGYLVRRDQMEAIRDNWNRWQCGWQLYKFKRTLPHMRQTATLLDLTRPRNKNLRSSRLIAGRSRADKGASASGQGTGNVSASGGLASRLRSMSGAQAAQVSTGGTTGASLSRQISTAASDQIGSPASSTSRPQSAKTVASDKASGSVTRMFSHVESGRSMVSDKLGNVSESPNAAQ